LTSARVIAYDERMVTLRQATPADSEFLFELHVAAMRGYIEATWGWNEAWQREYFDRKFDPAQRQVIQVDGEDAGVLAVEERNHELYLALIELLPAYQGRGIGSDLVTQLQARARAYHLPLTLHVLKTNTPARRLYLRLGFVIVAEEEARYKMAWRPEPA
jgi:ribosomal protein S18 acetylase RimI-like enzyme